MENKTDNPMDFKENLKKHIDEIDSMDNQSNLQKILQCQKLLRFNKSKPIILSLPIIKHNDIPVIFPNTINVIQGQAGVHKSRVAEHLCASLLKKHDCSNPLLGFQRTNFDANYTVLYVDTERNLMEQFPLSIQSILRKAGYQPEDDPINFEYISLLPVKRKERFSALEQFLKSFRDDSLSPLFIVLDVSTDCIEDFNRTDSSLELIDLMNNAINNHNVVFVCLIHENPNTQKARGHFGTELMNKSSTVIQIARGKDDSSDVFIVSYLKTRSIKKPSPFHIKYCQERHGLVCLNENEIKEVLNKKLLAKNEDVMEIISDSFSNLQPMKIIDLINVLIENTGAKKRTIERRLKEIIDNKTKILVNEEPYFLIKSGVKYKLEESETDPN